MALSNLSIEVLNALGIIFASLLLACLLYIALNRHVSKVTKSTKTTLNDEILAVMEKFAPIGSVANTLTPISLKKPI
jgi:hypothetical protein